MFCTFLEHGGECKAEPHMHMIYLQHLSLHRVLRLAVLLWTVATAFDAYSTPFGIHRIHKA